MVMEYCARGSLHDVLKLPKYDREITWEKVFKFAREMTEGMKALHTLTPPIYHRDMKSLNLLVFLFLFIENIYIYISISNQ